MTTATISNFRTATVRRLSFHGHRITPAQLNAYLVARTRKFEKLMVQYKAARGPILIDADFDHIAADLAMWRQRWLSRVSRHG